MQTYFSTFISGTEEIIEHTLKKRNFEILHLFDGLVVYRTSHTERDIRQIRFFNNSFVLLGFHKKLSKDPIRGMMRAELNNKKLGSVLKSFFRMHTTFRVVTSVENQTVAPDRTLLNKFEKKLLHNKNLSLDIRNPEREFWFMVRSEGVGLFGLRFTFPNPKTPPLHKGELRHELAHILCLVSQPSPKDVILDPFGGHGAIPLERAGAFPYKEVIAVESDTGLVQTLRTKAKRNRKALKVLQGDATNLKEIKTESIDTIITDPPWGLFEKADVSGLYGKVLDEFHRVLKPKGIAVLLIGNKEVFEKALNTRTGKWKLAKRHDILVSGKKAGIYKIVKV